MARVVIHTTKGPHAIVREDVGKSICQCGLSKKFPFCDNSHMKTLHEEAGKLYTYDENGNRKEIKK